MRYILTVVFSNDRHNKEPRLRSDLFSNLRSAKAALNQDFKRTAKALASEDNEIATKKKAMTAYLPSSTCTTWTTRNTSNTISTRYPISHKRK